MFEKKLRTVAGSLSVDQLINWLLDDCQRFCSREHHCSSLHPVTSVGQIAGVGEKNRATEYGRGDGWEEDSNTSCSTWETLLLLEEERGEGWCCVLGDWGRRDNEVKGWAERGNTCPPGFTVEAGESGGGEVEGKSLSVARHAQRNVSSHQRLWISVNKSVSDSH